MSFNMDVYWILITNRKLNCNMRNNIKENAQKNIILISLSGYKLFEH